MHFKKHLYDSHKVLSINHSVFPKIAYHLLLIQSLSPLCTLPICSMVRASVDYYLVCDDPVSFLSLVSLVKRQSRLVEFKDVLFSKQYTSRSAIFSLCAHSYWSGCTESSMWRTSKGLYRSLGTKTGLLPPTFDVQSASVHANSFP